MSRAAGAKVENAYLPPLIVLTLILGLLLVGVFGECSRVNICFKARTTDAGTHDGNIVKGQWTQSEI